MALKILLALLLLLMVFTVSFYVLADLSPVPGGTAVPGIAATGAEEAVPDPRELLEPEAETGPAGTGVANLMQLILLMEGLLLDHSPEADQALGNLSRREDVFGYLANLALAERDFRTEETTPADYYRRALDLYGTDAVRFKLAAWLAREGQEEEAISVYLSLLPADEALTALQELGAYPTVVSRALLQGGHFQAAAAYLGRALETATELSVSARLELAGALGQSLAQQGQYAAALPYLEQAFAGGYKGTTWWYARTLEALEAAAEAASLYAQLGPAGAYRLGLLLSAAGQKEEAAATLALSNNPAALWQGARLWEELGRPEEALQVYQELARGESRYRDDAAYRAYILLQRKGLLGAGEMLEILREYPAWAVRVTGETVLEAAAAPDFALPEFIKTAELLQQHGRRAWAEIELAIGQARAGMTEMLALGEWYRQKGDYFRATRWGMRSLELERTEQGYLLAYQRPFAEIVLEAAARYELEPHLIWAVMREESHFRPEAVSRVGALGLMQIMPATGREIARSKGMKISNLELLQPEVNIDFGAYYLRRMLDQFGGDLDKALAAYNGGPGNVRRWSRSPLGTAPEDFPSVITFLETREYLTKVLNSYHIYNLLYGPRA